MENPLSRHKVDFNPKPPLPSLWSNASKPLEPNRRTPGIPGMSQNQSVKQTRLPKSEPPWILLRENKIGSPFTGVR